MDALKIRRKAKRKKPAFKRQELHAQPMLKNTWRKPRGIRSKLRMALKARGKKPSVGFRSPVSVRGLNPTGLQEVLVSNPTDLTGLQKNQIVIIRSSVGKKKRLEILEAAHQKKIPLRK